MTLPQLRRIRWAVRATLVLGVIVSVIANVLHAVDHPISQTISAWPPLALLITVELISRVPVHRKSLAFLRLIATAAIAGIAAWISYWHMAGVAAKYGETGASAYLLPVSVDGLIVVASICLIELGGRISEAQAAKRATATAAVPDERPAPSRPLDEPTAEVDDRPLPVPATAPDGPAEVWPRLDPIDPWDWAEPLPSGPSAEPSSQPSGGEPEPTRDPIEAYMEAARTAVDDLQRDGLSLSRDNLATAMRARGAGVSNATASAIVQRLREKRAASRGARTAVR